MTCKYADYHVGDICYSCTHPSRTRVRWCTPSMMKFCNYFEEDSDEKVSQ